MVVVALISNRFMFSRSQEDVDGNRNGWSGVQWRREKSIESAQLSPTTETCVKRKSKQNVKRCSLSTVSDLCWLLFCFPSFLSIPLLFCFCFFLIFVIICCFQHFILLVILLDWTALHSFQGIAVFSDERDRSFSVCLFVVWNVGNV